MARAKVTARTKAKVKRTANRPVKAGSTMPRNVGGYANAKVVAIVKRKS